MKSTILRLVGYLRESYWFIPSLMTIAAAVLAVLMIYLDGYFGTSWMDLLPGLYTARPEGARGLLSAVGGSMIGVAGTTFSVTIAAVVYASGQYGPRLLTNFMADRGNQVTLGTFIATFIYTIVVLRSVRSAGEGDAGSDAFVPQLALLVAMLLVVASIAVLIYFIHHVPQRIHINGVIERIGTQLLDAVKTQFPDGPTDAPTQPKGAGATVVSVDRRPDDTAVVRARAVGYIRLLDNTALIETACDKDVVVTLRHKPGDFIHQGTVLAWVWPRERCDEAMEQCVADAFTVGSRRTPMQDIRFLIDELVEIGTRALSSGVNDPFTANSCIDWLTAAFAELAGRETPSGRRFDDDGNLRIVAVPLGFDMLMRRSFGGLAQYVSTDRLAAGRFLDAMCDIAAACPAPENRAVVVRQVERFRGLACSGLPGPLAGEVGARAATILAQIERSG